MRSNRGNSLARQGKLKEALEADPLDPDFYTRFQAISGQPHGHAWCLACLPESLRAWELVVVNSPSSLQLRAG